MIKVEAYLDEENNDLKAQLSKDSWSKEYFVDNDGIDDLMKYFSASKLVDFHDDGMDALFLFDDYQFKLTDYKKVFENERLNELFLPLFYRVKRLLEVKKASELHKKKVKRIIKYVGSGIVALGITGYLLYSNSVKAEEKPLEKPKVQEPTIEQNDNKIENDYSMALEALKEKAMRASERRHSNVELDIPDHDVKFIPPPRHVEEKVLEENNDELVSSNTSNEHFFVDYEDRTSTDKAITTKENYSTVIGKYAKMYGLDPKLMLAIATQETGNHYKYLDFGPAIGLMQIEKNVWRNGGDIRAYNFETNSWETISLTPADYDNFLYNLRDLDYNVKIACMLFQYNLRYFDYNILAGIQAYNMGMGSVGKVVDNYCMDKKLTREQVLENQYDDGWLLYRNYISSGDSLYIEHVLSYCDEDETISVKKPDGTIVSIVIGRDSQKTLH